MIEFFPEDHSYQVDGIIAPSVTTLIGDIWIPNKYAGVSKGVLRKAADYGNRVHELIENADGDLPEWYVYGYFYKRHGYMSAKGIKYLAYRPQKHWNHMFKDEMFRAL